MTAGLVPIAGIRAETRANPLAVDLVLCVLDTALDSVGWSLGAALRAENERQAPQR